MQKTLGTLIGKTIRLGLSFRHNGGHALPGLVVDRVFPGYVGQMLAQLPQGVVVITGTNGKTTTTKIVSHILSANGKKVLTNSTGSNLVRGIASSLAQNASLSGKLNFDIAVLEIDEATAKALVKIVQPRWVLGLNVSRDQLDRFGEVDTIAKYISVAMEAASEGVVINSGDPHLLKIAGKLDKNLAVHYFGAAPKLSKFFPSDFELAAVGAGKQTVKNPKTDVELLDFKDQQATYKVEAQEFKTNLQLTGQHNFLNGAAAIALCRQLLPGVPPKSLISELSRVSLAFGRGEKYRLKNGAVVELVLVKNPASFTQALASYGAKDQSLMIAINDNIADGRDVSWLWDVNFEPLSGHKIAVTSGTRAADMALRLSYDDIKVGEVQPNLESAVNALSQKSGEKVILSTYTAMLALYSYLNKKAEKVS